jgi:hypothetical protein
VTGDVLDRHLRCGPVVAADTVVGVVSRRSAAHAGRARRRGPRGSPIRLGQESETNGGWSVALTDGVVALTGPVDPSYRRLAFIVAHTVPGVSRAAFPSVRGVDR